MLQAPTQKLICPKAKQLRMCLLFKAGLTFRYEGIHTEAKSLAGAEAGARSERKERPARPPFLLVKIHSSNLLAAVCVCVLPPWATAHSQKPGPRGRTQPRPAKPAPKLVLTSPPDLQQNTGTRKMT